MILAIVQARMSSTRLPGKVMVKVMGKPLIGYLLERLSLSKKIDKMVVAMPTSQINDELAAYVESIGCDVFRGEEDDVLDRFYQAASRYKPESIVIITADCPLIDPAVCDHIISVYQTQKADLVHTAPTFAEGLDVGVFSYRALEISHKKSRMRSEREHAGLYMKNHPEEFEIVAVDNKTDDSRYRITVDESEDLKVVKEIIGALYKEKKALFTWEDIKRFLDNNPHIAGKNAHIIRNEGLIKSLREDEAVK